MTTTDQLAVATVPSPIGDLTVIASDRGLRSIAWPGDDAGQHSGSVVGQLTAASRSDGDSVRSAAQSIAATAVGQLEAYFAGELTEFDLPLDPVGSEFQRDVWQVLRTIPFGHTITYGEQAGRLGDRNKARAVGAANGKNPIPIVVPCHRVVGSTGDLTGFAGGLDAKRFLLDHERRVNGTTLL